MREISTIAGVSERTIYRRMTEYDLKITDFYRVPDNQLDLEVLPLANVHPFCGKIMLRKLLKDRGFNVERYRLRDSIYRVNDFGVQARKKRRLNKRVYNVKGANHLCHIDTNHKLIKWHIIIFGAIDGYSRLPVSLECINNNKATTVLSCFLKGVEIYGIPSRVRSDKDKENVLVAGYMIEKRGSERWSMITGPSTHNQQTEHLWRDVFDGVLALYYELFTFMEDNELLDPFNQIDIAALHYIFIPLINNKLDAWRHAWSKHRIRTIKTSLIRLWVLGQTNSPTDDLTEDEVLNFGVEGLIAEDDQIDRRPTLWN